MLADSWSILDDLCKAPTGISGTLVKIPNMDNIVCINFNNCYSISKC
jgi:hypothetical protein